MWVCFTAWIDVVTVMWPIEASRSVGVLHCLDRLSDSDVANRGE